MSTKIIIVGTLAIAIVAAAAFALKASSGGTAATPAAAPAAALKSPALASSNLPGNTAQTTAAPKPAVSGSGSSSGSTGSSGSSTSAAAAAPVYSYTGNNGSVTGSAYCQGAWGSSDGKPKNMVCIAGINAATKASVGCDETLAPGNYSFACDTSRMYDGNNGSVSGSTYCAGAWGSANGQSKNMACVSGVNTATKGTVGCEDALSPGNYSFACKPAAAYSGNNGSVTGTAYCQGVWGSSDGGAKNMACIGGFNAASSAGVGCNDNLSPGNYTFFCK